MNGSSGVEFGLFDWIDQRDAPTGQIYEERLQLLAYADAAPFVGYHLAEHHNTPLGLAPSPALFLSAAAQRTRRLRLGPLVYLLPLYEPLRLIEEVSMLDQLSNGRLDLGVGRGVSPYELGYHHVDAAQSRAIFREALDVLVAGMTERRLSYQGAHFRYDDVPLVMQPRQRPHPPLWYATTTPESIIWAAEQGLHLMRLGPAALLAEGTALYRRVWQEHQADTKRLGAAIARPRLGFMRQIYLAPSAEQALAEARPAFDVWWDSFDYLWRMHDDRTYAGFGGFDNGLQAGTLLCGSPDTVRPQIAEAFAQSGCDYLMLCFTWGGLTHAQALRSITLFVEEVMPAFTPPALQPA